MARTGLRRSKGEGIPPERLSMILEALGLSEEDYRAICEILRRSPTHTELAMFSVEWSEHCSYRRSKRYLRELPREGRYPALVGEDAGGFILGDLAILFKVESHNHPSQVEPRHGAATGVGGIIRDIVGSGGRPIAILDSLRFGPLDDPACRRVFTGVIDGIQWYGNCIGVPTVGGEVYAHDGYRTNCLVNVMCVGVAPRERLITSKARPGGVVVYLGARTGRDGIGGCSVLASQEIASELSRRPSVQIGDPFFGKCLVEATLEALDRRLLVALKDMGAAGLTCTTTEMSAAGGCGMAVELEKVPLREAGMEPFEIMMSESQERMLGVVEPDRVEEVLAIFHRWGIEAVPIGRTVPELRLRISFEGEVVADLPVREITSPIPIDLPATPPSTTTEVTSLDACVPHERVGEILLDLLAVPAIASKRWIWEQYDHMVQTNTIIPPGGDAAVLRLKGRTEALAVTIDGNSSHTTLDPYWGAQGAVAEAARNLLAVGAVPAAVTDGLNFGTPEKPERFWSFVEVTRGIRDACKELSLPVVSGNVSFYNESPEGAIPPTPIIGMVGVLDSAERAIGIGFRSPGDQVILLGRTGDDYGGSQLQLLLEAGERGMPPRVDWDETRRLTTAFLDAHRRGWIRSAHDCAEGGVAVAVAEACLAGRRGGAIVWEGRPLQLFSESHSRLVVTVAPADRASVEELFHAHRVPATLLGTVEPPEEGLTIRWMEGPGYRPGENGARPAVSLPLRDLANAYEGGIPSRLDA